MTRVNAGVVNDVTKKVVQISDRSDPGWMAGLMTALPPRSK